MHTGDARITVRRDGIRPLFEGMFTLAHQQYHIQLGEYYEDTKHELDPEIDYNPMESMVVFKDADIGSPHSYGEHAELRRDLESSELSCNSHNLDFNSNPDHALWQDPKGMSTWGGMSLSSLFGKRQIDGSSNGFPGSGNGGGVNLKNTIGNTAGCPTTRKVALIGVATDCTYTGSFNSTDTVRKNIINQINAASAVYENTFNISLGLQNLTVSPAECPGTPPDATPWNKNCDSNTTITDRLNLFSTWRSKSPDTNAYWTLLTNCNTGSEVGLAWLGQLCVSDLTSSSGESTSGANVVAKTSTEWQVIAHESGHTFGAVHDCDSQTCADANTVNSQQCCPRSKTTCDAQAQFIMNPSTGGGITSFSPCTVGNICSALSRNSVKSSCLSDNKGVKTVTEAQCGNGIVENGEECDCGGEQGCTSNSCCDAKTCKFKNNAVCDDSNEDCCKDCQFASQGTVCRASTGECDPKEVCSGNNATCPPDANAPDGQDCGNSLKCASGQCTSRDLQCKTLMGSYTTNNDTYACNSQDCTLSCASPQFGPNECYSMTQNFLDGTPCGGGGTCANVSVLQYYLSSSRANTIQGNCKGSSVGKEIGSWISNNKPLVIGICAGVGGLILLCILGCIVSRCRRKHRAPRKRIPSSMAQPQQWPGQGPAPAQAQQRGGWDRPMSPQNHWQGQSYGGYGVQSVRYA